MDFKSRLISTLTNGSLEALFVILLVLIIIKQNNFFTKEHIKENVSQLFFKYVIPMCFISALIDYYLSTVGIYTGLIRTIVKTTTSIAMFTLVILTMIKDKNKKQIINIIKINTIVMLLNILLEILTIIFIAYGVKLNLDQIISSTGLFFIMSIPERLIQYGILIYFYIKKNSITQVSIFGMILQNKTLKNTLTVFSIIDFFILIFVVKYFFILKAFEGLSVGLQLSIVITALSLVIINILAVWITAICIYPRLNYLQKNSK